MQMYLTWPNFLHLVINSYFTGGIYYYNITGTVVTQCLPVILNFLDMIIDIRQVNFMYFHYSSDNVANATANSINEFPLIISDSMTIANFDNGAIHINQVILYGINLACNTKIMILKAKPKLKILLIREARGESLFS